MAGSLTVIGFGPTTDTAYWDALAERDRLTKGDARTWVVADQRYTLRPNIVKDCPVMCEVTLELVEEFA